MPRKGRTDQSGAKARTKKKNSVGYRRPPEESRFPKGTSGNPGGRPKGSKNVSTYYRAELKRKVPLSEGGKRKRISKLEANIKQEVTQGAGGNLKAVDKVLDRAFKLEERDRTAPVESPFTEADREVILAIYQRMIKTENPNDISR